MEMTKPAYKRPDPRQFILTRDGTWPAHDALARFTIGNVSSRPGGTLSKRKNLGHQPRRIAQHRLCLKPRCGHTLVVLFTITSRYGAVTVMGEYACGESDVVGFSGIRTIMPPVDPWQRQTCGVEGNTPITYIRNIQH